MDKETYTPQVYIKIDKIVFNTGNVYPSFDKNDDRTFTIKDGWNDLYSDIVKKENKDES